MKKIIIAFSLMVMLCSGMKRACPGAEKECPPASDAELQAFAEHYGLTLKDVGYVFKETGTTLLHMAVFHGRYGVAARLIAMGANVKNVDRGGCSILDVASHYGYTDIKKLLIRKGARRHKQ